MTLVVVQSVPVVVADPTLGYIAGEAPDGIVTIDNVPGTAIIDVLLRSNHAWLRRAVSAPDGTYVIPGLPLGVEHDLIARDITNVWDDVIVGRVLPFVPVRIFGTAPPVVIGLPYSHTYTHSGGEGPFSSAITDGALPDGLTFNGATHTISGTATAFAVASTWEVTLEDVRGDQAVRADGAAVYPAGSRTHWRILISANNGYAYVNLVELQFNGAQATGGIPIYSTQYDSGVWAADKAFDNVLTGDSGWSSAAADVAGSYLGYVFSSSIVVSSITMIARTSAPGLTGMPRDFVVQSSLDGVVWSDEWTVAGQTGWTANQARTFNRP